MPPATTSKRVKGKRIERAFIIGSEARELPKVGEPGRPEGIPDDHTKAWKVYVRIPDGGPDITHWLKRVQFKIFNTYANPLRTVEAPPFQIEETGWGGFTVEVRLHFVPEASEKPQWRQHWLQLEPFGTEEEQAAQRAANLIRAETFDYVEFNEPTEGLWDQLTSDNQWDYLTKGTKGLKAAGGGIITEPKKKDQGVLGEGSVELKEKPTEGGDPYSKRMEEDILVVFSDAEKKITAQIAEEEKKREAIVERLKELRGAVGDASITVGGTAATRKR